MKKISILSCILLTGIISSCSNTKHTTKTTKPTAKTAKTEAGKPVVQAPVAKTQTAVNNEPFLTTQRGLQYKVITHGPAGGRKPVIGDQVEMHIHMHVLDSVIFDSRKMANDKPVPFPIQAPAFNGDPSEAFTLISVGDSVVILVPADSMKKAGANMPWLKDGGKVEYDVVLVSTRNPEEVKAEEAKLAAAQNGIDDKLLQDYFKKNNLHPQKTASGLYYIINKQGTGENAKPNQDVFVNYTGMTLDGKKFDSNVDSAFHHVAPFDFPLGQKRVIAGWDEGVALMKKGTKATLYIPSSLAYGHRGAGGAIGPDAVLIFEVEVTDIKAAAPPPPPPGNKGQN